MLEFSESVSFDYRLAEADIIGSIAHARMLGERGIIRKAEAKKLIRALKELGDELKQGKLKLSIDLEDVHMNIEARLGNKVGELAGKLHTARSRNDQVNLDMRIYFREMTQVCIVAIIRLIKELILKADRNQDAVMPGFTHTRKAQPVLFAHHLLAYVEMLSRDLQRFFESLQRVNVCPLGAGALAGTTFPVDRKMVADELGFDGVTQNSIDAVSDRDFLLEFAACASITMVHLSRLMEELIWWGLPELGFVELPEEFCTGSSMMPNKMNPDAAELVRGKSGRVIGSLVSLLTVMKGTPLSYNRDFQEDKEGMFDAAETTAVCLEITRQLIAGMKVRREKMKEAAATGFMLATDLADYLVRKGMPFRDAHEIVGKMVRRNEEEGRRLEDLGLDEMQKFSGLFDKDVKKWLSLEASVRRRNIIGGTAPAQVKKQLKRLKKLYIKDG
jgi:argininosuccinate lyase